MGQKDGCSAGECAQYKFGKRARRRDVVSSVRCCSAHSRSSLAARTRLPFSRAATTTKDAVADTDTDALWLTTKTLAKTSAPFVSEQ